MKTHLGHVHPSTNSSDFQKGYIISNSERVALEIIWEKQATGSCQGPGCNGASNPLSISNMHSLCQATLSVFFLSLHSHFQLISSPIVFQQQAFKIMKTVIKMMSGTQKNCSENEFAPEVTLNHWTTDAMTEDRRMPGGSNAQKASKLFLEHTIDKGNTADHSPEQTRQQTLIATITTQNQLQSVNQKTEFTIKAQST